MLHCADSFQTNQGTVRARSYKFFRDILVDAFVEDFGTELGKVSSTKDPKEMSAVATRADMSLDELEAFLADGSSRSNERNEEHGSLSRRESPKWTRCKAWDACAIGNLPGRPPKAM